MHCLLSSGSALLECLIFLFLLRYFGVQYVVVEFISEGEDKILEVGRSSWITERQEKDSLAKIAWPPKENLVPTYIIRGVDAEDSWKTYNVKIKRMYDSLLKARAGLKGFIEDSSYETDHNTGRGWRKKRSKRLSSSSEEELPLKQTCKEIPAPPTFNQGGPTVKTAPNARSSAAKARVVRAQFNESQRRKELKERVATATAMVQNKLQQSKDASTLREASMAGSSRVSSLMCPASPSLMFPASPTQGGPTSSTKEIVCSPSKSSGQVSTVSFEENETPDDSIVVEGNNKNVFESYLRNDCESNGSDFQDNCESDHQGDGSDHEVGVDLTTKENGNKRSHEESYENRSSNENELNNNGHRFQIPAASNNVRNLTQDCCSTCNFALKQIDNVTTMCKKLLVQTEVVSSKLDTVLINQGKIKRVLIPHERKSDKPMDMPTLQLDDVDALSRMEKYLEEGDNFTGVVFYLTSYLCNNEASSAKQILQKLMTNTLAKQISMEGRSGKIRFNKTKLYDAVEAALLTKFNTELEEAKKEMITWFCNAAWRKQSDGSRGKRDSSRPKSPSHQSHEFSQEHRSVNRSPQRHHSSKSSQRPHSSQRSPKHHSGHRSSEHQFGHRSHSSQYASKHCSGPRSPQKPCSGFRSPQKSHSRNPQ